MKKWIAMILVLGAVVSETGLRDASAQAISPNILFIIADDMGLDASPCYAGGGPKARMPNLEKLCAEGIVYDKAWTYALCSPSRAALMTGRYGFRTGIGFVIDPQSPPETALSDHEISLHRLLTSAEMPYATAHIGKWHLAHRSIAETHPAKLGVTHFDGYLPGTPMPGYGQWPRTVNGRTSSSREYMTSAFADAAIAWIALQQRPWLMWLAFTAPHAPYHVPPAHLHSVKGLASNPEAIKANPVPYFHAMLEALDTEIGRVLASLAPAVRANTLVIFMGDNGSSRESYTGAGGHDRTKGSLYQGGLAVPLIVAGAGVTRKGARDATVIDATDLYATIADAAQVPVSHRIDGRSFKQTFVSEDTASRKFAYSELAAPWIRGPRRNSLGWTIRDERYKLVQWENGTSAFFDLDADPNERRNLLAQGLDRASEVRLGQLRDANAALKR